MKRRPLIEGSCYLSEWFTMYLQLTYMGSSVPLSFSMTPINFLAEKGVQGVPQGKSPHINTSYG